MRYVCVYITQSLVHCSFIHLKSTKQFLFNRRGTWTKLDCILECMLNTSVNCVVVKSGRVLQERDPHRSPCSSPLCWTRTQEWTAGVVLVNLNPRMPAAFSCGANINNVESDIWFHNILFCMSRDMPSKLPCHYFISYHHVVSGCSTKEPISVAVPHMGENVTNHSINKAFGIMHGYKVE